MAIHGVQLIARAAPILVVSLFIAWARQRLPISSSDQEQASQAHIGTGTQLIFTASMIAVGIVLLLFLHASLVFTNRLLATRDGPVALILYPSQAIWWIWPGFIVVTLRRKNPALINFLIERTGLLLQHQHIEPSHN